MTLTTRDPAEVERLVARIEQAIDAVASLDEDRILRNYLAVVAAMTRTDFFQSGSDAAPKPSLSFKVDPSLIALLPEPRPRYEIFVYSPRMEGVHLRGGKVARGGLRWSDRREDFRTETLGLMKAQMVKNAVIVPVGAKGGFIVKHPPVAGGSDALHDEVIACYRIFVGSLLDITDNIVAGELVPPSEVVRYDDDDPYLVVAADKGTATLSDIANEVSAAHRFWLGDAFASGGSFGYDHKKIGITARGAWESVKRHFRERGVDIQTSDFTVVGIGDMSGDVFGNGMLLSPHIRLVGAFNHTHVFLDPDPDPQASHGERRRLFELPGSAWSDFDPAVISRRRRRPSADGKVHPAVARNARSAGDRRCGAGPQRGDPRALARAGRPALERRHRHLRQGNLRDRRGRGRQGQRRGARQRLPSCAAASSARAATSASPSAARIEYAVGGGRINTDAIDNVGGVNCSDHEVNIKILLDAVVAAGDLTTKQRNELLAEMTGEVAALVLRDSYTQTQALSLAVSQAPAHARRARAPDPQPRANGGARSGDRIPAPATRRSPNAGWPNRASPRRSSRCCSPTSRSRCTPR